MKKKNKPDNRLFEIALVMSKFGINGSNITTTKKESFKQILKEYFKSSNITDSSDRMGIIKEVMTSLK